MVIVGRHIGGITINPLEYLLNDDSSVMEFTSRTVARGFLRKHGYTDKEMKDLVFETNTHDPPLAETNKDKDSNSQLSPDPLAKAAFMAAKETISRIEDLLTEAGNLFDKLPSAIQSAILAYHSDPATLQHCLRWGLQAAKEIRADWPAVVTGLPCDVQP